MILTAIFAVCRIHFFKRFFVHAIFGNVPLLGPWSLNLLFYMGLRRILILLIRETPVQSLIRIKRCKWLICMISVIRAHIFINLMNFQTFFWSSIDFFKARFLVVKKLAFVKFLADVVPFVKFVDVWYLGRSLMNWHHTLFEMGFVSFFEGLDLSLGANSP